MHKVTKFTDDKSERLIYGTNLKGYMFINFHLDKDLSLFHKILV